MAKASAATVTRVTQVRALCIGGSWAGTYQMFNSGRDATRVQQRTTSTPLTGHASAEVITETDSYTLEYLRYPNGAQTWFAIADGNTIEWAIKQLMFAYSVARQ